MFRQADQAFVRLLDNLRYGRNVAATLATLAARCSRALPPTREGIRPTLLYSKNVDVDTHNKQELAKLPGAAVAWQAYDSVQVDKRILEHGSIYEIQAAEQKLWRADFFRQCLAGPNVEVKVGAQVMLLRNIDLEGALSGGGGAGAGAAAQGSGGAGGSSGGGGGGGAGMRRQRQLVNGSRGVVKALVTIEEAKELLRQQMGAPGLGPKGHGLLQVS